ncbi:MAG: 5-(carboxyamino)imidazole ribonucleotide synthase [Beijerinckiaceae bacterium]
MKPDPVLAPGATIGILGGGQLGRMLALAGARLGLKAHIYAPEASEPAFDVAAAATIAPYEDETALAQFAEAVDVITYEFENIPAASAAFLAARQPVHPGPLALEKTQDRLIEKHFLNDLGIATAPFAAINATDEIAPVLQKFGGAAILKTCRFGYDGKGQAMIRDPARAARAFAAFGKVPAILEGIVPFAREISALGARGRDGDFRSYDICENSHANHILARTQAPAAIAAATAQRAGEIARCIADALDYVGMIAVEMFVIERAGGEDLVVNEIAPRVHNSGHWTIDGAVTSQFEQHMRAVCGWPLGSTARRGRIVMDNLIGDEANRWREILAQDGACLHLYGKAEIREGRKMGHVTRVLPDETR